MGRGLLRVRWTAFDLLYERSRHSNYYRLRMGHNTLPTDFNGLLALGRQIASGLDLHGAEPGITEMSTSELQRNLEGAQKADIAWSAARSAKVSSETRLAAANEALAAWLTKARLVVMLARGEKWSQRWIETGFTHRAANVPKRIESRISLARRVVVFLALHPDFGVPFAEVTAARGRSIYEWAIQTRDGRDVAMSDCKTKKGERATAERLLRQTLHRVIRILRSTLVTDDSRWLAFGLNRRLGASPQGRRRYLHELSEKLPPVTPLAAEMHPDGPRTVAA